jgi:23S rRNA pseudouridine2604 synthase
MGEIVNKILRARYFHEKEYLVDCDDAVSDASIQALSRGIELDDGPTRPCTVERVTSRRLRFVLTEGRNRQIRRMVAAIGREVVRLKRVRVMSVTLDTLAAGTWRELDHAETQTLLSQLAPDTVDEGCFDAE